MGTSARDFLGIRARRAHADRPRPREDTRPMRRRLRAVRARARGDDGISVIEVVVAFVVLMIVLVPLTTLLGTVLGQAASARQRLTALSIAEQYVELLANSKPPLNTSGIPITGTWIKEKTGLVRSSVPYDVGARLTWTSAGASTVDLCTSGAAPDVLELEVRVTWPRGGAVTDTTVIDYPPAGLPTNGFVAVVVQGDPATNPPANKNGQSWSTRVQAVPVTVATSTGPSPYTVTAYPDQYGCVFEEVPPGTYTVSVADPTPGTPAGKSYGPPSTPAWVANFNERTSQQKSPFTVDPGSVTTVTFQYDEGSLLSIGYPTTTAADGGVTCPGATGIVCVATGQYAKSVTPGSASAELSVLDAGTWTVSHPAATRLVQTACAGTTRCIAVGSARTSGVDVGVSLSAYPGVTASFSPDSVPAGVSAISAITCPSDSRCYAEGTGTTGAVLLSAAVSSTGVAWTLDSVPAQTTKVSSISCPGAQTCYAVATTASGSAILSLDAGTTWVSDTLPATPAVTSLSALTCPGATTCDAVGTSGSHGALLTLVAGSLTTKGATWKAATLPATVTSLATLTCRTTQTCYATGTQSVATSSAGVILSPSTNSAWVADTVPSNTGFTELVCPSSTTCFALGSTSAGPLIASRSGATVWSADALPANTALSSLLTLACASASHCYASGVGSVSHGQSQAVILSLGDGGWSDDPLPSGTTVVFLSGIACGGGTCAAVGGSETKAVFLTTTASGATWRAATVAGATGLDITSVPISVSSPTLQPTPTIEYDAPSPGTVATTIGPLFAFQGGYSVAAAQCSEEMSTASQVVKLVPGATASAIVPMGILPLEVLDAAGQPVPGTTVTATISDPTCKPLTPLFGTNPSSFTLEPTDPYGLSEVPVIYDTYTVTVTAPSGASASTTVTVTPTSTIAAGVAQPLPLPVVVRVT